MGTSWGLVGRLPTCTLQHAHCQCDTETCTLEKSHFKLHTASCTLQVAHFKLHPGQKCTMSTARSRLPVAHCMVLNVHCTMIKFFKVAHIAYICSSHTTVFSCHSKLEAVSVKAHCTMHDKQWPFQTMQTHDTQIKLNKCTWYKNIILNAHSPHTHLMHTVHTHDT